MCTISNTQCIVAEQLLKSVRVVQIKIIALIGLV